MRRALTVPVVGGALMGLALLVGCASPVSAPTPEVLVTSEPASIKSGANFPLPTGAKVNTEQSLIMGLVDAWIGRIVLTAEQDMPELYAFYQRQMTQAGWQMIHSAQAKDSTLTFVKDERVITIKITPRWFRGCTVMAYVAPNTASAAKIAPTKIN